MRESLTHIDKQIIFRETFTDEQSVRKNKEQLLHNTGIPTDVTFSNGIGTFDGTTSKIDYDSDMIRDLAVTTLIRIKFNGWGDGCSGTGYIIANGKYIIDVTDLGDYIGVTSDGGTWINSATDSIDLGIWYDIVVTRNAAGDETNIYIDGVLSGGADQDSGNTSDGNTNIIIGDYAGAGHVDADIELVEIYNYVFTVEEVVNFCNSKRHFEPVFSDEILNVSAQSGIIGNKYAGDTIGSLVPEPTVTATTVVKDEGVRVMCFKETTNKIDCGSYDTMIGDKTISIWLKPTQYGNNSYGFIINNAKLYVYYALGNKNVWYSSDGSGTAFYTPADSILPGIWTHVVIVREADGNANSFVNGEITWTYDNDSGTPSAVGLTNFYIGNLDDDSRPFEGLLGPVRIIDGLLSAEEISNLYTAEKWKFGK